MNRTVRLLLIGVTALMLLCGLAVVGWTLLAAGQAPAAPRQTAGLGLLIGLPLLMTGALIFAVRYLGSEQPRLSADHRRHLETSLLVTSSSALAIQAWLAVTIIQGAPFDPVLFIRLMAAWLGLSLFMRGNFMTKVGPPTGVQSPDPAAWARSMRRAGRSVAAIGAGLLVCSFALPLKALFLVMLATGAFLPVVVIQQRRAQQASIP